MPKEDWHKFSRSIKEDKHGVGKMFKLIQASGDGSKSQFHDSARSRLGKHCAGKKAEKGEQERKQREEGQKDTKQKDAEKDFTKVKPNTRQQRQQKQKEKRLPWEEFTPAQETKLIEIATNKEAEKLDEDDVAEDASGYRFVDADNLPKAFGEYVQALGPIALITLKPSEDVLKAMKNGIERVCKEVEDLTSRRVFLVIEEAQMCSTTRKIAELRREWSPFSTSTRRETFFLESAQSLPFGGKQIQARSCQ